MNKVFVLAPRENWIVDRFVDEWYQYNADISITNVKDADVVWLLSDWTWKQLAPRDLIDKKVLTTVHHIVPEKFNEDAQFDFSLRDSLTTAYTVYNQRTFDFIRSLTKKPIHLVKYWANQNIWKKTGTKEELRTKYGLPQDAFIVGSFQRDTEGTGISQGKFLPKLEKGPDLFADYCDALMTKNAPTRLHVLLAGWRRQYVINRLESAKIPYTYIELPTQEMLNELYQCLDVYPVTARCEGGPQSLIECGLVGTPVISRPVGIAEQVLPPQAIQENVFLAVPSVPNVDAWKIPGGFELYRALIKSL